MGLFSKETKIEKAIRFLSEADIDAAGKIDSTGDDVTSIDEEIDKLKAERQWLKDKISALRKERSKIVEALGILK